MLQDSDNVERNELEPVMGMIRLQSGKRLKIKYVWRKLINNIKHSNLRNFYSRTSLYIYSPGSRNVSVCKTIK